MASGKCTYLRSAIANLILSQQVWTPPTTIYVALSSAAFDHATTGATLLTSEVPSASGYLRVAIDNTVAEWNFDGTNVINANPVQFPDVTSPWTIASVYLVDNNAYTADDNVLAGYDLTSPGTVATGSGPAIAAGALIYTEG